MRRRENACVPACVRAHDNGRVSVCVCALSASDLDDHCIVGTARSGHMTLTHLEHRRSDKEVARGRLQESADRTGQHELHL